MNKSTDWQLLARYLSGECSGKEQEQVEIWLQDDPENQRFLEHMRIAWDTPESRYQKSDVKILWEEVAKKAGITPNIKDIKTAKSTALISKIKQLPILTGLRSHPILGYAALLLIAVSLPYFYVTYLKPILYPVLNEIVVENGKKTQFTLSDGTNIVLDAGSVFSYPSSFDGETREVFLSGEGYFEVSTDVEKPFIVHAHDAIIRVLGTKFNVRAWQRNREIKVAVAEGKVSLRSEKTADEEAVIITMGELSILRKEGKPTEPRKIDIEKYLSWQNREIVFEDTPLHEILDQLERWYDLKFSLTDSSLALEHLTVHIQNKPINDILELIALLMDLQYKRTGRNVVFNEKK